MANLLIRDVDEDLIRRLRERSVAEGLSVEEEHRKLLEAALESQPEQRPVLSFKDFLLTIPKASVAEETSGEDIFIRAADSVRDVDFE